MASMEKIKEVYYLRYRINGRQIREKIGRVSKNEALKAKRDLEEKLYKIKLGYTNKERIKIIDAIEEYLDWSKNNREPKTHIQKTRTMTLLTNFIDNKNRRKYVYINDIDYKFIESFKLWRKTQTYKDKPISNRTVNIDLIHLKNLLNKVKEWGYLAPELKIEKLTESRKIPEYLSRKELQQLIDNSSSYERQIILLLLYSGIRSKELKGLKWVDIDLKQNIMIIRNRNGATTKTHRDRLVPINNNLHETLLTLQQIYIDPLTNSLTPRKVYQKEYVICARDGLAIKSFRKAFKTAVLKSGLNKRVTPHMLRHSFATLVLETGGDIMTIKELLGHSDISTTQIYLNITNERKQEAVNKIGNMFDTILSISA